MLALASLAVSACGSSSGSKAVGGKVTSSGQVPATSQPVPTTAAAGCPPATKPVHDSAGLRDALSAARPGDVIAMADGTYSGHFTANAKASAARPIFLCGGRGAVLDGGSVKSGIALHMMDAAYWRVSGFTIRDAQKGVVTDATTESVIEDLDVGTIGDEAIHVREFSSGNSVQNNVVHDTGKHSGKFGEGIYIGSARSNWCTYTKCQPDRSDHNLIFGNTISHTTAENVDIKEGTNGGIVRGNHFDAIGMTKADSWVDVKGNGWRVQDNVGANTGRSSIVDGYQTHQILDGWGTGNLFEGNSGQLLASGFGFDFTPVVDNKMTCDNKIAGAGSGLANVACQSRNSS
jgi:hypothetical protein